MASESTILVVDDDPLGLEVACTTLRHLEPSWDILGFDDPHNALEIAWGLPHCVVVTDWNMPGMDGLEITRRLRGREDEGNHAYHILLISARSRIQDMEKALELADDFLLKPYEPREMRARIHAGLRRLRREGRLIEDRAFLAEAAETDPLTGIRNRRALLDLAQREFERFRRRRHPLSLLMLDIDHFKRVNDTYGHEAGDCVLKEAAQRMVSSVRPYDTVARWGGEEFVVLSPHCGFADALVLAERIRKTITLRPIPYGPEGQTLSITSCVGVASAGPGMEEFELVLRAADRALYTAKHRGRNLVAGAIDSVESTPMIASGDPISDFAIDTQLEPPRRRPSSDTHP
jgi:diguanylate cyclase (GGDEF)-like protein